jgi:hypothetical protein
VFEQVDMDGPLANVLHWHIVVVSPLPM